MLVLEELVGQVLDDKYLIEKMLGRGGMGAVYRATHLGTTRPVAIKVIAPQFMAKEEFVQRFRREAEATGRLRHPNVVNVTDFGFANIDRYRIAYLVLEYLDGQTLADMLAKRGRLPVEFTLDIVEQICLAIDKAHKQGIIHRDLKPDNIWLEPDGRGGYNVKVLDFGLAKLCNSVSETDNDNSLRGQYSYSMIAASTAANQSQTDTGSESRPVMVDEESITPVHSLNPNLNSLADEEQTQVQIISQKRTQTGTLYTSDNGITQVGAVVGTPLYMSPEQCLSKELDARSDIYSLGVIVYQMLSGETPFKGNQQTLLKQHIEVTPPALRDKFRDIPKSVSALISATLAKAPDDRPATAFAFANSLRANLEGESPILTSAQKLYRRFRFTFTKISIMVYTPAILLISILGLIEKRFFWLAWPVMAFANILNTAACTMVIENLRNNPAQVTKVRTLVPRLLKSIPSLIQIALLGGVQILYGLIKLIIPGLKAQVDNTLTTPVAILEGKRGRVALARSKSLVNRLRYPASSIQMHDLLLFLMIMVVMVISDPVSFVSKISVLKAEGLLGIVIGLIIHFVPSLIISSGYSPNAIATALIYYRARQISGEVLDETMLQTFIFEERLARPRQSAGSTISSLTGLLLKRTAVLGATFLLLLLTVMAPYLVITLIKQPLVIHAQMGRTDRVKELLAQGTDVNIRDTLGRTALMAAAEQGYSDTIKILIARGADLTIRGLTGDTALMSASENGHQESVKILLESAADVNVQNNIGETALMKACRKGHIPIVRMLLTAGANTGAKNRDGKTALMMVNNQDIVEILQTAGAKE